MLVGELRALPKHATSLPPSRRNGFRPAVWRLERPNPGNPHPLFIDAISAEMGGVRGGRRSNIWGQRHRFAQVRRQIGVAKNIQRLSRSPMTSGEFWTRGTPTPRSLTRFALRWPGCRSRRVRKARRARESRRKTRRFSLEGVTRPGARLYRQRGTRSCLKRREEVLPSTEQLLRRVGRAEPDNAG